MSAPIARQVPTARRRAVLPAALLFLASLLPVGPATPGGPPVALASHTPEPTSVTIAGSLQSEIGCTGDWDPACAASHLTYDAADGVWQGTWALPAGSYEYKAALNDGWDENYGQNATENGGNVPLNLGNPRSVKFYYDHATHWVVDNVSATIATVPGNFQAALGCPGDWDPACLRSWLEDPDGDGIATFETTALPAGSYEAKVALDESWDVNFGQGGVQNGANIPFTVPAINAKVVFRYDAGTHVLTISSGHRADNNVEWDGVRHDSRSDVYRTPGGAVPAGTPVTLRLRTFADDVTAVRVRFYSVERAGQQLVPMTRAARGVSCYDPALAGERCDFWQLTVPADHGADNLWYRFVVTDGTDTDYYADETAALDGGPGAMTDEPVDQSWALMLHEPGFTAPAWAKDAVVYQIFPDRFRNGRPNNDPRTGDVRYDDPVLKLRWGQLPEGYCRNYTDASTGCPWRFDTTPPADSPTKEQPRGRDYFGGDLMGVRQQLDYLKALGVTAIYFNPIFDAGSNHGYDTQDYTKVDPYFGTPQDWSGLVKQADARGIRIILDGVFNHLSSDSPIFDRYHHYATVGACESATSVFRDWFVFTPLAGGPCAGPDGPNTMTYAGWFGFDSIPVINKAADAAGGDVWSYFLTGSDAIARRWLELGASGWRMDVSGDASFPDGYWQTFREIVKQTNPQAITISETWQKDSSLLRALRGDRFDSSMNYRLRDAVIAFLAPGAFDSKGFADSGRVISAAEFASRMASIREDTPDAAYYALLNLLDSHDTERALWTLTPGAETRADKEQNAANLAAGKRRLQLASLIQFTVPGMPSVYYGDEVGMTGDDDPDDRRTYPWADLGGSPDTAMLAHYRALATLRRNVDALTDGDFRILAVQGADAVAYGRRTGSGAAVVAVNRGGSAASIDVPVAGYLPDGTSLTTRMVVGTGGSTKASVTGGLLHVVVPANGALVLATGKVDLAPPPAPVAELAGEGDGSVTVSWGAVPGAAAYEVEAGPLSGGGYTLRTTSPVTGTSFTVTDLPNATTAYVVVRALDAAGNASARSNEVHGLPHPVIGWANLQWPPTMTHTISTTNRTATAYGQVWIDGVTPQPGATPYLRAQLGFGPEGSDPAGSGWSWVDASFNIDAGNNDEFMGSLLPEAVGAYDYVYRYSVTDGRDWLYADLSGPVPDGSLPSNPGKLTVESSGDTTPPDVPADLVVVSASAAGIELDWGDVPDAALYEVARSGTAGGPYAAVAQTSESAYVDTEVAEGATYHYVVRAIDGSWNRSGASAEVTATAELRTVSVTFRVTVPAATDGTGRPVNIAGTLAVLDGSHPDWDPGGTPMTRVDAATWEITLTGAEGTQLQYKYALGSWDYVEKDASCSELSNRLLTLAYGANGTQQVNDAVANWRNVAACGD